MHPLAVSFPFFNLSRALGKPQIIRGKPSTDVIDDVVYTVWDVKHVDSSCKFRVSQETYYRRSYVYVLLA